MLCRCAVGGCCCCALTMVCWYGRANGRPGVLVFRGVEQIEANRGLLPAAAAKCRVCFLYPPAPRRVACASRRARKVFLISKSARGSQFSLSPPPLRFFPCPSVLTPLSFSWTWATATLLKSPKTDEIAGSSFLVPSSDRSSAPTLPQELVRASRACRIQSSSY